MKKSKLKNILLLTVALCLTNLLGGCGSVDNGTIHVINTSDIPISVAINNDIVVNGVVESATTRNIYTTLGFMIDQVFVSVGDQVTEGQLLARLDTADLESAIAQQMATLETSRQNTQNTVINARRMLSEAQSNLENNTNIHIVSAQSALSAAKSGIKAAQANYDNALRDYQSNTNPQVLSAESFYETARIEFERIQLNHTNLTALYTSGIISSDEMRQSENALVHALNQYNDARINYDNSREFQQRTLEQLRIALQSATAAHSSAEEMYAASRTVALQEVERLINQVTSAEISANLNHIEAALEQLERHLNEASITAPISGTITSVIAQEGAVGLGLMFVVEDIDNLRIITNFREYDLARLKKGMEVTITSDGTGGEEYMGVITKINPSAVLSAPVVKFEAEVSVTSEDTNLRVGMNTRLNIALE